MGGLSEEIAAKLPCIIVSTQWLVSLAVLCIVPKCFSIFDVLFPQTKTPPPCQAGSASYTPPSSLAAASTTGIKGASRAQSRLHPSQESKRCKVPIVGTRPALLPAELWGQVRYPAHSRCPTALAEQMNPIGCEGARTGKA